jgi:hypothetical protein
LLDVTVPLLVSLVVVGIARELVGLFQPSPWQSLIVGVGAALAAMLAGLAASPQEWKLVVSYLRAGRMPT